jgi:hypothetical protein
MPLPPTWLDKARAAGDWQMVDAYLDEQLGPITLPAYPLTSEHDALLMRYTLLHLPALPSVDAISLLASSPC